MFASIKIIIEVPYIEFESDLASPIVEREPWF